jgi:hypothetical protein
MFVHHVFFWLKPANTTEDNQQFEAGVGSLKGIKSIKMAEIGKPAISEIYPWITSGVYSVAGLKLPIG